MLETDLWMIKPPSAETLKQLRDLACLSAIIIQAHIFYLEGLTPRVGGFSAI